VKVLDPPLLLERLERRLAVLTGGLRDAPERQQTLRSTIEWSYDLLDPTLQWAFRRLAVFRGTFSLEAAEVVAGASLDDVSGLVDWNLLKPIGQGRFLMLETIREFGAELLDASDEAAEVRAGHLDFFLALVMEAEPLLIGPDQRRWYELLRLDHDNVREALNFASEKGDGERALMLAGTIWRFWWNRGQTAEAGYWYERAFAVPGEVSPRARARGVFGAAHVTESRGNVEETRRHFEQAADLLREIGDTRWQILALTHLAQAHHRSGDVGGSEAINEEALAIARASGDIRGAAVVTGNLAYNSLVRGEEERAARLFKEALAGSRAAGDTYSIANDLQNLGILGLWRGDIDAAAVYIHESLELTTSIGDTHTLAHTLAVAAAVALARGDSTRSARLCAADEALCNAHGFELDPLEQQLLQETSLRVRHKLGGRADESWAAGRELDLSAAVELALSALG
jgi:tetratricopeptide (TPR) repeat protein